MLANKRIPLDIRFAADDHLVERQRRIASRRKGLLTKLTELQQDYRRDIRSFIGEAAFERFSLFRTERERRLAEHRLQIAATTEGRQKEAYLVGQLAGEAKALAAALGIETDKVAALRASCSSKVNSLIQAYLQEQNGHVHFDPGQVPDFCRDSHFTWRFPPYDGSWGANWDGWDGTNSSHQESSITGETLCTSDYAAADSDDGTSFWADAMSEVWVWFQLPNAGLIEAWVSLQAIDNYYRGSLRDLSGFSDASIDQRSSAYMEVILPDAEPRSAALLNYHRGEDEGSWSGTIADPGSFRDVQLFSRNSYAAGQTVLIAIGVDVANHVWLDDMLAESYIRSQWFVHHVALRSTGGG